MLRLLMSQWNPQRSQSVSFEHILLISLGTFDEWLGGSVIRFWYQSSGRTVPSTEHSGAAQSASAVTRLPRELSISNPRVSSLSMD